MWTQNTNHRLYHRYSKMIKRCHDENNSRYPYYGARGIKVCDRWLESFDNFLEDMEPSFKEGLELDRINMTVIIHLKIVGGQHILQTC